MLFEHILKPYQKCNVELKSGIYFKGRLVGLDSYMNVVLDQLEFPPQDNYHHLASLTEVFLRGDKIKFITYPN